jgi:hypothetical protein
MSNSPICTVNGSATTNGVDVTASSTVTIALADTAGVRQWNLTCSSTDELNVAATVTAGLVINLATKTATFTAPATLGSALIFQSVINSGVDLNGVAQASYTTTFKVSVLTATSLRVVAFNESLENNATSGWTDVINNTIRNYTGSSASAGAGLLYSGGAYNIVSDDSSIVVNANSIVFRTAFTTLLNGATSAATVSTLCQRDNQGAINLSGPNGSAKYEGSITVTPSSSFNLIQTTQGSDIATNNLTIQSQGAFASATGSNRKPGDINLVINTPSNSGTTDGFVNVKISGATRISLGKNNTSNNSLISFPGSGEITAATSVLIYNGGNINTTFNSTDVTFSLPALQFAAATSLPVIKQADNTTNSVTAGPLTIRAANATGTNSTGGDTIIGGSTGTLHNGNIGLGATPSAGGGEKVVFVPNRTAAPGSNPTNGFIFYGSSGNMLVLSSSGNTVTLGNKPAVTGSKASGAALISLLTVLATAGLITDSTTA